LYVTRFRDTSHIFNFSHLPQVGDTRQFFNTGQQEQRRLKDAIQEGIATIKRLQGRQSKIIAVENDKYVEQKENKRDARNVTFVNR